MDRDQVVLVDHLVNEQGSLSSFMNATVSVCGCGGYFLLAQTGGSVCRL